MSSLPAPKGSGRAQVLGAGERFPDGARVGYDEDAISMDPSAPYPAARERSSMTVGEGPVERPGRPTLERSPGRKLRLLAVDDEPRILRLMNAVLSGSYDLATAGDGEEGLRLALSTRPDLILTDFNMPKMTGQELLQRLRQEPSLDDVPVIVLTGHEDDQLRVDLLRNGAQDFLVKPFSVEELRVRIANLLRVKQARELLQDELQSRERDIGALVAEVAARRAALQAALEAAQVARDTAERASQAKTTFLALVSHELRTPLAVLRLTVDRLRVRRARRSGARRAPAARRSRRWRGAAHGGGARPPEVDRRRRDRLHDDPVGAARPASREHRPGRADRDHAPRVRSRRSRARGCAWRSTSPRRRRSSTSIRACCV